MLDVTYYIEKQYGVERRYPVSKWAKRLCRIAGTKTLGDDLFILLTMWYLLPDTYVQNGDYVRLQKVLRKESDDSV